jgi:hypothetical protein
MFGKYRHPPQRDGLGGWKALENKMEECGDEGEVWQQSGQKLNRTVVPHWVFSPSGWAGKSQTSVANLTSSFFFFFGGTGV